MAEGELFKQNTIKQDTFQMAPTMTSEINQNQMANQQLQRSNVMMEADLSKALIGAYEEEQKEREANVKFDKKQLERWKVVNAFREKSGEASISDSNYKNEYGSLDLYELRQVLAEDTHSKSQLFTDMFDSLSKLLDLSVTGGRSFDENGEVTTTDFAKVLAAAKQSVHDYVSIRGSKYHFFENGKRRLDIAQRVEMLLDQLQVKVDERVAQLDEEEQLERQLELEGASQEEIEERKLEFRLDKSQLDIMKVIKTGQFGPKLDEAAEQKAQSDWLAGNFSGELLRLLGNPEKIRTKDEKNDFLAALMDKNNLLLANKMTITVLAEANKDATLGMPWLQDDLKKYIASHIEDSDILTLQPEEIAEKAKELMAQYAEVNKEEIAEARERVDKLLELIPTEGGYDSKTVLNSIYAYPEAKEMLFDSPKEFEERLSDLRAKIQDDEWEIQEQLSQHFSSATREAVRRKLNTEMAGLRLFGKTDAIITQVGVHLSRKKYVSPQEVKVEGMIDDLMKYAGILPIMKDHFVETITNGSAEELYKNEYKFWKPIAKQYSDNYKKNEKFFSEEVLGKTFKKRFLSIFSSQALNIPASVWERLEEMRLSCGEYKPEQYKNEILRLIEQGKESTEDKVTREEYLTRRKVADEENKKIHRQRAKRENDRIKEIGDSFDDKFLLAIGNGGEVPLEHYRQTDLIYRRKSELEKNRKKIAKVVNKELNEQRRAELKMLLQNCSVPEDRLDEIAKKFDWMVEGFINTDGDLFEDERLECERINLEAYGVRTWDMALAKISKYIPSILSGEEHEEIKAAKEKLENGIDRLKNFEDGRYSEIAEIIVQLPEVYRAIMSSDEKVFDKILQEKIEPRFAPVIEAMQSFKEKEFHGEAIYKQFVYSNLPSIYAGSLKGDAGIFEQRLKNFSKTMYSARINQNLKLVEDALNKKYAETDRHKGQKKFKALGAEIILTGQIKYELMNEAGDTEGFERLLDTQKTLEDALKKYEKYRSEIKDEIDFSKVRDNVDHTDRQTEDPLAGMRKEYWDKRQEGKRQRVKYLNLNGGEIHNVMQGKSLVRVTENKRDTVTLNQSDIEKVRGAYMSQVDFELPPVLRDAIIEEGAGWGFRDVSKFIDRNNSNPIEGTLYRHAHRMYELYTSLLREDGDDPAMSAEEAQMFAVRLYANKDDRKFFENEKASNAENQNTISEMRKTGDYAEFRKNYKKLKEFESEKITDPNLSQEQADMARNLRILLVTNVGMNIKGKKDKSMRFNDLKSDNEKVAFDKTIGMTISDHLEYLKYASNVEKTVRKVLEGHYAEQKSYEGSDFYMESEILALREYFMTDMIEDMQHGVAFREDYWAEKIENFYSKERNRNALMSRKDSVTAEDLDRLDSESMTDNFSEKTISKMIRNSELILHGHSNMYEKLDLDQKKFFAAALMLMDKGAIGDGTAGTNALLFDRDRKKEMSDEITAEIKKYIRGESYNLKIDYRDAIYKLQDYQNVGLISFKDEYKLSEAAYNNALLFAQKIYEKRQSFNRGEKDLDRIKDGYSSIEAAFTEEGKLQKNEIDKVQNQELTKEEFLSRLISLADQEKFSQKEIGAGAVMMGVGISAMVASSTMEQMNKLQTAAEKEIKIETEEDLEKVELTGKQTAINKSIGAAGMGLAGAGYNMASKSAKAFDKIDATITRLKELANNEDDLRLFLRIMQDRTVLDMSTGNPNEHVDQAQRDLLFNALTGDVKTAGETMSGYDDNESCHQAFVNALSFQLRDDAYFKGKLIAKDHFAEGALQRTTMVDWDLISRAFAFMDEIKERRTEVYVTSHATDLIRESGNTEAIKELDKLEEEYGEKKEEFGREEIENRLKELKSANTGYMGEEEIERAWAGYLALSDKEKNLFFRVLQRRDLLDISKKNYVKNYFGIADRNYLNATGRNELLDEFIQTSLGDGAGVQLDKDAYYQAMKTLLSTQVSDTVNLEGKTNLSGKFTGIFSYERFGIFGRGGAVDWKLFKRALSFVNRAKRELDTQEGNALLYQGAGDLEANGRMSVDYSFLRRNIHKTGNHWSRFIGNLIIRRVKEETGLDGILQNVVSSLDLIDNVAGNLFHASEKSVFRKGIKAISNGAATLAMQGHQENQFSVKQLESETEAEYKKRTKKPEEKEAEEAAEKQRRDELIFLGRVSEGLENIGNTATTLKGAISGMGTFLKQQFKVYQDAKFESLKAEKDQNNIVYNTVGDATVTQKGDIRDTVTKVGEKVGGAVAAFDTVTSLPFLADLKALAMQNIEKLIYGRFLNDTFFHQNVKETTVVGEDGKETKVSLDLTDSQELLALKGVALSFVNEQAQKLAENVFGKDLTQKLLDFEKTIYDNKKLIEGGLGILTKGLDYAQKCITHVKNIVQTAKELGTLKKGSSDAKTHREEDDEKLEKAGEKRLNERQKEKAKNTNEMHRGMGGMAEAITKDLKGIGIAQEVINFAVETVSTFAGKVGYPFKLATKLIQDGMELALYAIKVCTDRKALQDYFFTTADGQRTVNKLKVGFDNSKSEGSKSAEKNSRKIDTVMKDYNYKTQLSNVDMVDVISDSMGYEHTSELVEDVGMNMAQSLVFCASKFNPMMETKIMAMTVMTVMGMSKQDIGNTSPDVTRRLFEKFKMAR